jgi:lipopolysaccharide export system protein LptA
LLNCSVFKSIGYWIALFVGLTAVAAAQPEKGPEADAQEEIHISADRMLSDTQAQYVEFTGNVKANQGDTEIQAKRLKIFYQQDPKGEGPGGPGGMIEKITASGAVRIKFDDKLAQTQEAVYTTDNEVLVLSGPDSKVSSGQEYISGSKITVNRKTGQIQVEGSVKGVIYPKDKGID